MTSPRASYRRAADFLNVNAVDILCVKHEYGIFGGKAGLHPHVKAHHGETYRLMVENRAQRLGVEASMIFHDRFVSEDELVEFLAAADIYITPYLQPEQSTSGTLAYAVGAGKAVISTPYVYARELLADGRGVLCRGAIPRPSPARSSTCLAMRRSG